MASFQALVQILPAMDTGLREVYGLQGGLRKTPKLGELGRWYKGEVVVIASEDVGHFCTFVVLPTSRLEEFRKLYERLFAAMQVDYDADETSQTSD